MSASGRSVDLSSVHGVDASLETDGYEPYWDAGGLVLKGSPPRSISVKRKGARGDLVTLIDGAMTAGSNVVSSATSFSSATLDAGKPIQVRGAGATTARGTGTTSGTGTQITAATGWWMPGMIVTGTGIPANTEIVDVRGLYGSAAGLTLVLNKNLTGAGGAGTALSMVASVNGYISNDLSGGTAKVVTAPGGSTPVNATTTVAGVKVRYATDDTTAIGNAYALAALTGADVFFPDGDYAVNTITTNISKVRFTGSKGATLYQLFGASSPNPMFGRAGTTTGIFTDVEFDGLSFQGDPTAVTGSTAAIFLSGAGIERIRVTGCTFRFFHDAAAAVYHAHDVKMIGNTGRWLTQPAGRNALTVTVDGTATGAPAQAATFPGPGVAVISGNTMEDIATAGADVVAIGQADRGVRQRAVVDDNVFRRCGWTGIASESNGGSGAVTISDNDILECASGVQASNSNTGSFSPSYYDHRGATITGNTIDAGLLGGSSATGITSSISNSSITANTIRVPSQALNIAGQSATSRNYNTIVAANTCVCCNTVNASPQFIVEASKTDGAKITDNIFAVESETNLLDITGATAGTFTLSVVDPLTSTTYGPTAGIAWNASAAAEQAAIVAVLPANMADAVLVNSAGALPTNVHEITFTRRLAGRAITLTANFASLTGATAPSVTRTLTGATSHHALNASDTERLSVTDNTFSYIGLNPINLVDPRGATVKGNEFFDCNMRNSSAAGVGVGIYASGDAGSGLDIDDNKIVDRRTTPLMNYGIDVNDISAGVVRPTNNKIIGWRTGDIRGRANCVGERGTQFDTSGQVKNLGVVGPGWASDHTDGLPGVIAPTALIGWVPASVTPSAQRAYLSRFVIGRNAAMTIITLETTGAGSAGDTVDVGIYAVSGGNLVLVQSSGPTVPSTNMATAGRKNITIATANLVPNTPYYVAMLLGTPAAGIATLRIANFAATNPQAMFGTAIGTLVGGFNDVASNTLPGTITSINTGGNFGAFAAVRES